MLRINGQTLDFNDVCRVALAEEKVTLGSQAKSKIQRTRQALEVAVTNNEVIYGVTTGFGAFKNKAISSNKVEELQENLIKSHAVGVGEPFDREVVRGMMFLMANYLSKGHSGVRPVVIETLLEMLNKGVSPVVPQKGSVGSSGDLAPSAHIILVLIGQGEAYFADKRQPGSKAMKTAGITPLTLQAKEGLALINNTTCMTSLGALALGKAQRLLIVADQCGALSAEALRATDKAFDAEVHLLKAHTGQITVAANLRKLLAGSTMIDLTRVQDQYSIRCIPQIHGAVHEAFDYVKRVVNTELNSVTDNPLIFVKEDGGVKVISGGNFHGESVALALDMLGIAVSELANISDRRIASLLDGATNNNLPPFLAEQGGLNSGFMILQYTTAALVSENKVLAHPASVDSVPTSANVEDLVSMGTIAARKAHVILENVRDVLAIELIVASQAADFRLKKGYKLGTGTARLHTEMRKIVPYFARDEVYYPYIQRVASIIDNTSSPLYN